MLLKLEVSCVWLVDKEDENLAGKILEEQPVNIILDYIEDALHGDKDFDNLEASVSQLA